MPLAAAAPLCSFCHPNPFHPLLEWTLADSGLVMRNMPLPMRAEGGEAETGVSRRPSAHGETGGRHAAGYWHAKGLL